MFYRNSNDSKHNNIRIVSLAAGLALATAAVIGGSDLLKESTTSRSTSPVTQRIELTSPQFGTAADAVDASQSIRAPSQFGTAADAVHAAQGIVPQPSSAITDARDQALGIGQPQVGQSFATSADAVYVVESMLTEHEVASSATSNNLNNFLGLGQPGETSNVEPQFRTMADADYASR